MQGVVVAVLKPVAKWLFYTVVKAFVGRAQRPRRYRAALRLATAIAPPLRILPRYVNDYEDRTAIALRSVLIAATDLGIELDPEVIAPDPQFVREIADRKTGVIACGAHMALAPVFLRYLHDHGLTPVGLSARPNWFVCGTRVPFAAIAPGVDALLAARRHLKEGKIFALMIDRREPDEDVVPIPGRPLSIRLSIFRFARRIDTPLIFFATWLRPDGAVEIEIARPPADVRDPVQVAAACAEFFAQAMKKAEHASKGS